MTFRSIYAGPQLEQIEQMLIHRGRLGLGHRILSESGVRKIFSILAVVHGSLPPCERLATVMLHVTLSANQGRAVDGRVILGWIGATALSLEDSDFELLDDEEGMEAAADTVIRFLEAIRERGGS